MEVVLPPDPDSSDSSSFTKILVGEKKTQE